VGDGGRFDKSNVVVLAEGLCPPRDKVPTTDRRKLAKEVRLPKSDFRFSLVSPSTVVCARRRGGEDEMGF